MAKATALKRTLGLVPLTFYGVGLIIGAGVYSVIGAAAGVAGETLWWSFAFGAVIALLTGLSYAELATTYPRAGAEYVYLKEAFPRRRLGAFVIGSSLTMSAAALAATVSIAFAGYLRVFIGAPLLVAAVAVIAAGTAINIAGIKPSSWVNILFTLAEVAGLVMVIAIGIRAPRFGAALREPPVLETLVGAAIIFFVYLGFEQIATLAEEAKNPERHVPWAIFLSLGFTTVLYLLVALSVVALASPERLAASSSPLTTAVSEASPRISHAVAVIALFSTANTALITLIVASRMLFSMARSGDMPSALARLLPRRQTPWIATLAVFAISAALVPLGRLKTVGSLSSFLALIVFLAVHLSVIVLRYRDGDRERPFRVPLSIGRFPVLPAVGIISAAALLFHFEPLVLILGTSLMAAAAVLHVFLRHVSDS